MNLASLFQDSQHAVLMQKERPDCSKSVLFDGNSCTDLKSPDNFMLVIICFC